MFVSTETEITGKELPDELAAVCKDDTTLLFKLVELEAVFEYTNCEFTTTLPDVKLVTLIVVGVLPVNALLSLN